MTVKETIDFLIERVKSGDLDENVEIYISATDYPGPLREDSFKICKETGAFYPRQSLVLYPSRIPLTVTQRD